MKHIALAMSALLLVLAFAITVSAEDSGVTVSVSAKGTQLTDVLTILANKSGLNIVTSPAAEGQIVSVHLVNTPIEEALDLVVRAAGLGYERIGNSILVGDPEELVAETGLESYVINLQFADAFELEPLVAKIVDEVTTDPGGNRLVVVASPGSIEDVRQVIEQLDVPPVQILAHRVLWLLGFLLVVLAFRRQWCGRVKCRTFLEFCRYDGVRADHCRRCDLL